MKELEELERRVAAKKQRQAQPSSSSNCDSSCANLEENFEKSLKISEQTKPVDQPVAPLPSLATMFLTIMSIFSILNQIYYKPTAQS